MTRRIRTPQERLLAAAADAVDAALADRGSNAEEVTLDELWDELIDGNANYRTLEAEWERLFHEIGKVVPRAMALALEDVVAQRQTVARGVGFALGYAFAQHRQR